MPSKVVRKTAYALRDAFCEQLEPRTLFAALPAGFAETQIASGILSPTAMTVAPDGRVFITSQDGTVRIVQNGQLLPTPFLSLTTSYGQGSQGIMGIALDPNFESNGYVYIDYTVGGSTSVQRISRFTANGNVAVPGSEDVLFQVGPQTGFGHIGGGLTFGSDGDLYFSYGDDNLGNIATLAPQLNNFYTKILRIEPDGTIPTDNPFYNQTTGNYRAIWAYGIRQAFKISEQSTTGLIYIADVGEGTWEDIFQGVAGANYGWPTTEGPTSLAGITPPVYAYPHTGSSTGAYSITGGFFYNPANDQFPSQFVGDYFFGDWGTGLIQTLNPSNPTSAQTFATGANDIVGLDDAPDGSIYYLTRGDTNYGLQSPNGQLFQVQYTGSQAPSISVQPASTSAAVGATATFSVAASGTGPFTYQWQENNSNILGATSSTFTTPALSAGDDGSTFDVIVTNSFNSATSAPAVLSVTTNPPPTVTLTTPAAFTYYVAGKALDYSASATDPAYGTLPGSDFAWTVDLYHDNTITTVQSVTGVTSGSYLVPSAPLNDADALYRVTLTVTDPDGLSTSAFQDVLPTDSYIDVTSNVPGAQLTVDGSSVTTPYSFLSIAGTTHTIAAASSQMVSGTTYQFGSWSDSGAASHTITTPLTATGNSIAPATTFTANYSTTSTNTAAKLVISKQPTTGTSGIALSPSFVVDVENAAGSIVTTNTSTVTLALASEPTGGRISGTVSVNAVGGVATFNGLSLNIAGAYTLAATDGTLTKATSSAVTIGAGATAKLVFVQQPTTGAPATTLSPVFIVDVEDAAGNIVTTNSSAVTLALASEPSGGKISGTVTLNAVKGVATFSGLSLSTAGAYTLAATDGSLTKATSSTVTIAASGSKSLFTSSIDIGSPKLPGSASYSNGTYTVTGEGSDIYNTIDQFHYDYASVTGNATISAKVTSVQNINSWSKAGVMIRASTAANSAFADVVVTPAGYVSFQYRTTTGGAASMYTLTGKSIPQYVKLVRTGNTFSAYYSSNGTTWTQIGKSVTIAMSSSVTAGLAVTSVNTAKTCTATFTNVTLT